MENIPSVTAQDMNIRIFKLSSGDLSVLLMSRYRHILLLATNGLASE